MAITDRAGGVVRPLAQRYGPWMHSSEALVAGAEVAGLTLLEYNLFGANQDKGVGEQLFPFCQCMWDCTTIVSAQCPCQNVKPSQICWALICPVSSDI